MLFTGFISRVKHILLNLNDQKWGRGEDDNSRPQKPPRGRIPDPELDALWQDLSGRLKKIMGGKSSGGGSDGEDKKPIDKRIKILWVIVPLALWLGSGFYTVKEAQRAILLTFGKYSKEIGPGFHWRLPFPIQTEEIVNIAQIRSIEIGHRSNGRNKVSSESLMLTNDENIIDVQITVQYRLKSAAKFLFSNVATDETVKLSAETTLREVVGRYKMDYVLSEGREQVANEVADRLQKLLDLYKTGVLVSGVILQNAQPPEQVQDAFDDAVKAGQDMARQKNEGEAYANKVIPRAKGLAGRMLSEAEGYKARILGQAKGDALRFKQVLKAYEKAPKITRSRMYLETMEQVFSNVTKIVVDSKKNNNLLYLPLDKIIAQSNRDDSINTNNNSILSKVTQQDNTKASSSSQRGDSTRERSSR